MQIALTSGYTFQSQQRRIDFSGVSGFAPRGLRAVINVSAGGRVIYAVGDEDAAITAISGSLVTFAYDTRPMADNDLLVVLYDDGVLPATAPRQDTGIARLTSILAALGPLGTEATLQQILTTLQAQRVETIWTDDTGVRFIRVDRGGTITWTDVAGTTSVPPGAGARPDSDSGLVVSRSSYRATASGTGFASGDFLDHFVVTDGDAGDLVSNFWVNATAGTKIAAPSAGSITPLAPLPDGASTAARQDTLAAALGAPADAPAADDTTAATVVALLRRGLARWTTLLARIPALVSGRMPVDGSGVVQPISATAMPLPNGAATEATLQLLATHADEVAALAKLEAVRVLLAAAGQANQWYAETTIGQAFAAGALVSGTARDGGAAPGAYPWYAFFVMASQPGTVAIYSSPNSDGSAGTLIYSGPVVANQPLTARVPNVGRSMTFSYTNSNGTAGTLTARDAFMAA